METSLVMITSVVIVNTATMILGDTTLLGCILSECLKQKLKSLWQPVRAENYITRSLLKLEVKRSSIQFIVLLLWWKVTIFLDLLVVK